MTQNLIDFYNNWTAKVAGIAGQDLSSIYDKYITSFVIYNNLYNQVPDKLIASGQSVPSRIFDNKAATILVVQFLGSVNILTRLTENNNDTDISAIVSLIDQETFYIKIKNGQRQRNEDLKILADLKSSNLDKKATAVLQVIYYVRCNMFHGQKDFQEYQRLLVEPLINILTTINKQLFDELNK